MGNLQELRYFCTNELCHYEFKRITDREQTADIDCPNCSHPLALEEL